ncbi:unnamed protein product [Eruca vesicaria subsp. sativa]|uniref:Uncharacterized protein n=1 Tax=Eruca vesicaria subsp. sativa TaxID=29727 RepID=A0ABC8KHM4_ERUVS|nr:unnamed protein product [Eruca vesicaria subsp. sativa]
MRDETERDEILRLLEEKEETGLSSTVSTTTTHQRSKITPVRLNPARLTPIYGSGMTAATRLCLSLEWIELSVSGSLPPPRYGHTATMVEKSLLVFGGQEPKTFFLLELITTKLRLLCVVWLSLTGGGGPIMGDLWALKGLIDEGN